MQLKMVLLVAFKYIADKLENKVSNTEIFWLVKRRRFQECPETTKTGMFGNAFYINILQINLLIKIILTNQSVYIELNVAFHFKLKKLIIFDLMMNRMKLLQRFVFQKSYIYLQTLRIFYR